MAKMIEAWGEVKSLQDWLRDARCNPELTYDVLRRRIGRPGEMSIPEIAITFPVIGGAMKGDTKERVRDRHLKAKERYKGFILAQKVREKYAAGVDRAEIRDRFDISENYLQKIISQQVYFNAHWEVCRPGEVPEHFKELKRICEDVKDSTQGLEKFAGDIK
jgi:hypothetical protein